MSGVGLDAGFNTRARTNTIGPSGVGRLAVRSM